MFNDNFDLLAVLDGHNGVDAANFAAIHIPRVLEKHLKSSPDQIPRGLVRVRHIFESLIVKAFVDVNAMMKEKGVAGGTTALVTLIGKDVIHFANLGDCRCVS